jgi:tetratricopeptide (TPR) repeat protein
METDEAGELVALAHRLRQQGRFAEAKSMAERALELRSDDAGAWFNFGAALGGLGELDRAEAAYRRALQCNARYAEAWSNLGGVLGARGAMEEQLAAYRNALKVNPRLAPVWSNLANALCNAHRYAEAESASRRAIEIDRGFVAGWVNLGRALKEMKRPVEAKAACERAVEYAPHLADAWAALGNALMATREFSGAIEAYRKAIALRPHSSEFHTNLGIALRRIGSDAEGHDELRTALALDPANEFASWNFALSLLERGELAEGWARYEARWSRPESPRRFQLKGGAPFTGRILLWGEQGVGDQILYGGMAAEVAQSGSDVTLEIDPRLVSLFSRSFPAVTVVPQTDPPQVDADEFDHVLPLGSLGRFLRSSFAAFPRHAGYLVTHPARRDRYREFLLGSAPRNSLIVGIAWRSSNPELGNEKTAPLSAWAPVLTLPGVTFVSLQYGNIADERRDAERRFGTAIATVPELDVFADLDGLAALHAACDFVLTTSTVNAHFAGGLGQAACVLLPRRIGTLWYWFGEREDSPWYPSLRLVRQTRDGDWSDAMELAARILRARVARAS